jgi:hypothetical protein
MRETITFVEFLRYFVLAQDVFLGIFLLRGAWVMKGALSASRVYVYTALRVIFLSYALVLFNSAESQWAHRTEGFSLRLPIYIVALFWGMYGITTFTRMQRLAPRRS